MGVSPPPLWLPPNAITPEQVILHYRAQRRGGAGGQALSPPLFMKEKLLTLCSGTILSILINQGRVEEHTGIRISSGICSDTWYYEDSLKNKRYCK